MTGLPWVRVDSNIYAHDKILALVSHPNRARWQALSSYFCALGWAGGAGTDGRIPPSALGLVHGTKTTARLLVEVRLWEEAPGGWQIVNFSQRQQISLVTKAISDSRRKAGLKGNCKRYHGAACWDEKRGCRRV